MNEIRQTDIIPFVGDCYNINNGLFIGSCTKGPLPVLDVNISENRMDLVVGLSGLIDQGILAGSDVTHVVLGVEVEVPIGEDSTLPVSTVSNMLKGDHNPVMLPLGIRVEPGNVHIVQFHLMPKDLVLAADSGMPSMFNAGLIFEINAIDCVMKLQNHISNKLGKAGDNQRALKDLNTKVTQLKDRIRGQLYNCLSAFSSSVWVQNILQILVAIYECQTQFPELERGFENVDVEVQAKELLQKEMAEKGVQYITDLGSLRALTRARDKESYIIFFCKEFAAINQKQFRDAFEFFDKFLNDHKKESTEDVVFAAVDLDVIPKADLDMPPFRFVSIRHFGNGRCMSFNLMRDMKNTSGLNLAKALGHEEGQPKKRAKLLIPCPKSFEGRSCSNATKEWVCEECKTFLDYGYDNMLYCNCGGARLEDFKFRCMDYKHGTDYTKFHKSCETSFSKMVQLDELNILILGQSGVGKSTWINGTVNYMMYDSLDVAKQNEVLSPIPTKFTVTDDNYKTREITCGHDDNEDNTVGASATQDCRTYTLRYKNYFVKLMDTPGLSDHRGIDQDRKNVKKILDHIKNVDYLNGICILLKPNESRIGVLLRFCVKEILAHLHKNCSRNIVYCFTNSRSTLYKPGDTLPVLEKLLDEIDVRNTLTKNTIFCLDNEAYRFLCTSNVRGVTYTSADHNSFRISWDKSVEETKRLLDHVASLEPHRTQETLSLNLAKSVILSLTRPIADITHNIEINIALVEDRRQFIQNSNLSEQELLNNLFIPQVALEQIQLGHPRTVCVNSSCVKYHVLPDAKLQVTEYVTHCHPHCYLSGIQPETYPNEGLKHCAAMAGRLNCQGCSCSWSKHMHIYYEQRRTEIKVKNHSIQSQLGNKADSRKAKELLLKEAEDRLAELEGEKKKIIANTVKFAHFLKKYAITPYNDAFNDYLLYLIDQEESKPDKTHNDLMLLQRLKDTRAVYAEEVRVLEDAMSQATTETSFLPADVRKWEQELYRLPIHGDQLRRAMELTLEGERSEARYNQKSVTYSPMQNWQQQGAGRGRGGGGGFGGGGSGGFGGGGGGGFGGGGGGRGGGGWKNSGQGQQGGSRGNWISAGFNYLLGTGQNKNDNASWSNGNPNYSNNDNKGRGKGKKGGKNRGYN